MSDLFDPPVNNQPSMTNVPEFSVSDLSLNLKAMVEGAFSHVRVRGELSRVTIAKSGHCYSSIKDDNAVLDAIIWRGTMSKISVQPEEGLEVVVTGRLTTYPGRSNYQIIIEDMALAGQGALLKMLEERRKKLQAEGLFDSARKKQLPTMPTRIGVITSPTGAVIRDILHRLQDRFPCHVMLYPVNVQGAGAAAQVIKALKSFETLKEHNPEAAPDLLIVARGGGSIEDLMPFNDEAMVRAIAASSYPIISAIGHETDTTLVDYAADLRAPTPTGAAEMAVPVRAEMLRTIEEVNLRLGRAMDRHIDRKKSMIATMARGLIHPRQRIENVTQRLDMAIERLARSKFQMFDHRKSRVSGLASQLKHPQDMIKLSTLRLENQGKRLSERVQTQMTQAQTRFEAKIRLLESFSYKSVLKRGFAVIKDSDSGQIIKDFSKTTPQMTITLHDGDVSVKKIS